MPGHAGNYIFTDLDIDLMQELMNIAFGKAAAELAEHIDIFVKLDTPHMKLVRKNNLVKHIREQVDSLGDSSIVEQLYRGDMEGVAFLIFPHGVEREFTHLFQDENIDAIKADIFMELEKEILLEVGNILIGACTGRFFELIDSSVSLFSPRAIIGESFQESLIQGIFGEEDFTISIHTGFNFEDKDISGFLFLISKQNAFGKMKEALTRYREHYK